MSTIEDINVVTYDEAKAYLGIDYDDQMITINLNRAIVFADAYLCSAVGEGYPRDDAKAKEAALMVVDDVYNNRGLIINATTGNMTRKLFDELLFQLRLELSRRGSNV